MSLIAWYPLNGDTKDYSGNNLHLTNNEATVDVNGKIGSCYLTNQSNKQYLNVTSSIITDALSNGNDFTVCFWQKVDSCRYAVMNISCGNTSATDRMLHIGMRSANVVSMGFYGDDLNGTFSFSPDKWYHITAVYEKGYQKIYVNGKLINSRKSTNYLIVNGKFNIGSYSNTTTTAFYNDVRIYNEALSAKQIKEIAQAKICHYICNEQFYENTVNLYNNKNQIGSNGPKIEWENTYAFKFEIQENTTYSGVVFNSNLTLKPLTTYTLSYKLKKIEGSLTQIRGHVEENYFDLLSTRLNGKENYYHYHNGIELKDSFDTHCIEVTFRTKEDVTSMNKIYIQPNAKKNEYVKVRVWDVQVEEKDYSTPFISGTRLHKLKDISGFGYDMVSSLNVPPVWKNDEDKSYIHLDDKAYYYLTNSSLIDLKEFTYSCWIRTTDTNAFAVLGAPTGNNSNHSLAIRNGKICLHSYFHTPGDAKADIDYAIGTTNVADEQWHLATITYNDVTVKTYVDGKLEAQTNLTMNFARKESDRFGFNINNESNLGQYEDRRFIGDIRDARIYATALSAEDIKLLYQPEISIDKANVIRCSEINEEKIENKNGFNKDASITYNEFNEIPNIESGIHNLKLGNEILPVLVDMDNDGGRWARVFYHNCKSGTVLFSSENSFAEAKETNTNAPTTSDKYSILSKLENFRPNTNSSFEFKLKYPTDSSLNKWIMKHYSNITLANADTYPLLSDIEGLTPTSETIIEDTHNFVSERIADFYIRHYKTKVYCNVAKTVTLKLQSDDTTTCYINNTIAFKYKNYNAFGDVTMKFNKGWNTLELLYYEHAGADIMIFNDKISNHVDILDYNGAYNDSNIWKQTSNPTHQKVTGYKPIKIDWTSNYWGGLEYSGNTSTLIDGSANHNNWYYAIGAANKHGDGIPSCTNVNNNGTTTNDVELWVRINNYDLFSDNLIENVSISRNGILTAKEFREIY